MVNDIIIRTDVFVSGDYRRMFPVINVDVTKDIPKDYPGAMGVPITFMDKFDREQFELLALGDQLYIGDRKTYKRLIIRGLKPALGEMFNLSRWLRFTNADWYLDYEMGEFIIPEYGVGDIDIYTFPVRVVREGDIMAGAEKGR